MSKAIGNVLMMGLSEEEKDEDKMLKLRAEAENYARMANPIDAEIYVNQNIGYLNLDTLENVFVNPNNFNPYQSTLTTENNIQYAQADGNNPATNVENHTDSVDYSLYGDDFSKEEIDQMLQDQNYQQALKEYAIPNEGGYVNNPNDPGGETNMGIAKRYHSNEDIKNLTRERANAILYNEVWNWNGINKLPPEIQGFVFDYGIRTSPQNAITTVHQALDIPPGGTIIGDVTLDRLNNMDYEEFLRRYQNIIRNRDKMNANYKYFGSGWDNRTNRYHVSHRRRKRI